MRTSLLNIKKKPVNSDSIQRQAAKILKAIAKGIRPLTDEAVDVDLPDNYFLTHFTTTILEDLAAGLEDLCDGTVDGLLKPARIGGSAFASPDKRRVMEYLDIVRDIRELDNSTYPQAQKKAAKIFAKNKTLFRGKPITTTMLKSWKRYPPGAKRGSQ